MYVTYQYVVKGLVQGVAFRYSTREQARKLGIYGWVQNNADGSVSVLGQGPEETMNQFEQWLSVGPLHANVETVTATQAPLQSHSGFKIFR